MLPLYNPDTGHGFGWIPGTPDLRDYTPETQQVTQLFATSKATEMLGAIKATEPAPKAPPPSCDLRSWFSPIDDQGRLGSCTAHAADSIMEYGERRAFGDYTDISRLFVYKITRDLLGWSGDTGATIRATMGALATVGAPPETFWKYDVSRFDEEPSAFLFALAQNFKATLYYRLDQPGMAKDVLLNQIKFYVAGGFPPMFGFTVYSSYRQADKTGMIPFPVSGERVLGGHAVAVAGYDDNLKIKNTAPGATETTGALLIKNSWGTSWGDQGYGWLPYEYVLRGQAVDWWLLLKASWIPTGQFGF